MDSENIHKIIKGIIENRKKTDGITKLHGWMNYKKIGWISAYESQMYVAWLTVSLVVLHWLNWIFITTFLAI